MSTPPPPSRIGNRMRLAIALFLPALAWFLFQQGLSATMRATCHAGGPPIGPIWGAISLIFCAFSAWLAWPAQHWSPLEGREVLRFLARLAMIGAGLFALAIGFQLAATLIIPPCIN